MSLYDPATLAKLTASHGPDRALAIALGQDAATNADIAAWRALGPRYEPRQKYRWPGNYRFTPTSRIMDLAARGKRPQAIADILSIDKLTVVRVIAAHR